MIKETIYLKTYFNSTIKRNDLYVCEKNKKTDYCIFQILKLIFKKIASIFNCFSYPKSSDSNSSILVSKKVHLSKKPSIPKSQQSFPKSTQITSNKLGPATIKQDLYEFKHSYIGPFPYVNHNSIKIEGNIYPLENRLSDKTDQLYFLKIAIKNQEPVYFAQSLRLTTFVQVFFEEGANLENIKTLPKINNFVNTKITYAQEIKKTPIEKIKQLADLILNK